MVKTKYTETETEEFYDREDDLYRSFWDSEGSLHWGYFEVLTSTASNEFLQQIIKDLSWSLKDRTEFKIFETESMCALVFQKN